MFAKAAIALGLSIASLLAMNGRPKLTADEKAEVKEARKDAAKARKKVQREFICGRCKGSGRVAKKVTFGDRNEFKKEVARACDDCSGFGIRVSGALHAAMGEYYSVIAAHAPNLRTHIENKPTLGRWMMRQLKNPELCIHFQRYWLDHRTGSRIGTAYMLPIQGEGAYISPDADWTLVMAKVLGTQETVLLLFREWTPPELKRVISLGAPEKLIVVAYSEGRDGYEAWLGEWRETFNDPDRTATSDSSRQEREQLAKALTEANRLIEMNGRILTAVDVIKPR